MELNKTSAIVALFVFLSTAGAQESTTYTVTRISVGDTLNIRSGPGMNFSIAAKLTNGATDIQIRGEAVMNGNDEWVPITFPGGKGWTRQKYLVAESNRSPAKPADIPKPNLSKSEESGTGNKRNDSAAKPDILRSMQGWLNGRAAPKPPADVAPSEAKKITPLDLKTELPEGPIAADIETLIRKFIASDSSFFTIRFNGATAAEHNNHVSNAYKFGMTTTEIRSGTLTNEYTRIIDREKFFIYDMDAEIAMSGLQFAMGGPKKVALSFSIVQRGKKLYIQGVPH